MGRTVTGGSAPGVNEANVAIYDPDRRRFLLATIVTLLALPALWLFNRSDDSSAPTVAGVGIDIQDGANDEPAAADTTDPELGEQEPVFLDGPSSPPGGVAEIAVPAPPLREPIVGSATYSSVIISEQKCFVRNITTGSRVTIVNLDNNRSTTCVTTLAPQGQREDVVLHTRTYTRIADLTDAPIPVEIRR